jgi:hypothetical protein
MPFKTPFTAMPDDEYEYLLTLSPAERSQYLAGKREAAKPAAAKRPKPAPVAGNPQQAPPQNAPEAPQQAPREAFGMQPYSQERTLHDDIRDRLSPEAQRRTANRMADQATDAIRRENYSRVLQAREAKERQHEANLMAMQNDAMLQRLAIEQREREKDRILKRYLATGVRTRRLVNGQWEDV